MKWLCQMVVNYNESNCAIDLLLLILGSIWPRTQWYLQGERWGTGLGLKELHLFCHCLTHTLFPPALPAFSQTKQAFCGLWGDSDVRTGIQPYLLAPEPCTLGKVTGFLSYWGCGCPVVRPSDMRVRKTIFLGQELEFQFSLSEVISVTLGCVIPPFSGPQFAHW